MVTTDAGRAIYIVYSLFAIPIMTILISLMSDTFLSTFQKKAEKFGVRVEEDQRYSEFVNQGRKGKGWIKRLFRGLRRPTVEAGHLESGRTVPVEDEILEEEVLDEVRSIQESVNERIHETEGEEEKLASEAVAKELEEEVEGESSTRGTQLKKDEGVDGINEEDVERAIKENRGELDEKDD